MIEAVLFDKDGTLIDFHATWDAAIVAALRASAADDAQLELAAAALRVDLVNETITSGSPFIAESNDVVVDLVRAHVDLERFNEVALDLSTSRVVEARGASEALDELNRLGIPCVIVTNDWEQIARSQMRALGWHDRFAHIIGSDSGFGAKPQPGMVLGACELLGIEPGNAALVGDSAHDIDAGNAAGTTTVLTTNSGPVSDLAQHANYVVSDMSHLLDVLKLV